MSKKSQRLKGANQRGDNAPHYNSPAEGQQQTAPSASQGREKFATIGLVFGLFITLFQSIDDFDSHKTRALLAVCAGFGTWLWIEHIHQPGSRLAKVITLPLVCWFIVTAAIGVWWWRSGTELVTWQPPKLPNGCKEVLVTVGNATRRANIDAFHNPEKLYNFEGSFPFINFKVNDGRFYVITRVSHESAAEAVMIGGPKDRKQFPRGWDENYSSTAYEVVDEHINPVFQMFYKRPNEVVIKGVFEHVLPDGKHLLYIANDEPHLVIHALPKTNALYSKPLRPIFKYPSYQHQGEYADK